MKEAFQLASEKMEKSRDYNKKHYDSKIKQVSIVVGDRVLIRNVDKDESRKLKTYWEREIYEVIGKHNSLPVYTIKSLGPTHGRRKKYVTSCK